MFIRGSCPRLHHPLHLRQRLYDTMQSRQDVQLESLDESANSAIRPQEPSRKKRTILILLGCGILQLPIWGKT